MGQRAVHDALARLLLLRLEKRRPELPA